MLSKNMLREKYDGISCSNKDSRISDLESYYTEAGLEELGERKGNLAGLNLRHRSGARKTFPVKRLALLLLVLHNSALIVTLHYSRVVPRKDGRRYLPSTAVLLVEIIKLGISTSITFWEISGKYPSVSISELGNQLYSSIFSSDSWKLTIPAVLWTLQNSIIYIAISNLNPATFQVTYQLKILTTVLFSVALLGKRLSWRQCLALIMLTVGIAIVQAPGALFESSPFLVDLSAELSSLFSGPGGRFSHPLRPIQEARSIPQIGSNLLAKHNLSSLEGLPLTGLVMNASRGLFALLAACLISGITGVYFEKVLKDSLASVSVWTRNTQLAFYSLFPALFIGVVLQDGDKILQNGFFTGYDSLVWVIVLLQAVGGIIVSICVAQADTIQKNFAMSVSVVLSCVASSWFFDTPLTLSFAVGTAIVLLAVYLYHRHDR